MPRLFGPGHCAIDGVEALPPQLQKPKQKRQRFTDEDDRIIVEAVGQQQFPDWNEIAKKIPGKSNRQCRERFQHYLAPTLSQEPWTPEEDQIIRNLYERHGPDWARMAQALQGRRSNNTIKNRWNNHLRNEQIRWPLLPVHHAPSPVPSLPVPAVSPPVVMGTMSPQVEKLENYDGYSGDDLDIFWEDDIGAFESVTDLTL